VPLISLSFLDVYAKHTSKYIGITGKLNVAISSIWVKTIFVIMNKL
jgi:hypothetical protein